jgi:hypothetical protein
VVVCGGDVTVKKIFSANNLTEAKMIEHVLAEHEIKAFVQGEHANPSLGQKIDVWIEKDEDESEAKRIIAEITDVQTEEETFPNQKNKKGLLSPAFIRGLMTGILLSFLVLTVYQKSQPSNEPQSRWDSNGDGKADIWAEYKNNQLFKEAYDRNFDGVADSWQYFDPRGLTLSYEMDLNYDGNADYWEDHQEGTVKRYKADNDHDGRIDEWGIMEFGNMKERYWSFNNDSIVDKKLEYEDGRRVREMYDRDRDGEFDEINTLDEFERIISD